MKKIIYTLLAAVLVFITFLYWIGRFQFEKLNINIERNIFENNVEEIKNYFKKKEELKTKSSFELYVGKYFETDKFTTSYFEVQDAGTYELYAKYRISGTLKQGTLILTIGNSDFDVILNNYAYYPSFEFDTDRYGNEVVPEQIKYDGWIFDKLVLSNRFSAKPVTIKLKEGKYKVRIENSGIPVEIFGIYFVKKDENDLTFENRKVTSDSIGEIIEIQAETPLVKSDFLSSIGNYQTPSIRPFHTISKKVNAVLEDSFKQPGQKIVWTFDVKKSGIYRISVKYRQSTNKGVPVFRKIEINGKSVADNYPFEYTAQFWKLHTISVNSRQLEIWLDKGKHTISFEVETGVYSSTISLLENLLKKVQQIGIEIRKLVGNNLDPNRTWNITSYMPTILDDLNFIANSLQKEHERLTKILGRKGFAFISDLKISADSLERIARKPEKIPFYLDQISEGEQSVAQRLSRLITSFKEQPLGLDVIYIHSPDVEVKSTEAGFFVKAFVEMQKLWLSFLNKTENYSAYAVSKNNELTVWVNRPVQIVEVLQYLADTDFYKKTGIRVRLSTMPAEGKVILAVGARTNPDVALGLSNWIPYELALRGAVEDLAKYPDFWKIMEEYNIETLTPYIYESGIYGVTETQGFYVLFYRTDIFESMNLSIPNTWEDVKLILPELQRRGMNMFIPLSTGGQKYWHTTVPFIFQNDGKIYTDDGLKCAFNSENTLKAIELMSSLYSIYGLPEYVANFYNDFRYGRIPIGVSDIGTYVLLTNAADEIYGRWDIAPSPGVLKDGKVVRYQVASDRSAVIFKNSKKKEEAWEFLKWWLSKDTQKRFSYTLVSRYGPTYLWNTANIFAFKELDLIPEKHKKVILEQWNWIREVQRHPAGYMAERELSNIWNRVAVQGKDLRLSVDKSVKIVDREIERKLTEFGYLKDGNLVKEFIFKDIWTIRGGLYEKQK